MNHTKLARHKITMMLYIFLSQIIILQIPVHKSLLLLQYYNNSQTFQVDIVLSNNINFMPSTYVNGTNIGLVQIITGANNYQFFVKNKNIQSNNTVLIAIVPYGAAPIPGGCNMEFPTEIAPYQKLTYSDAVITVDAQPASINGHRCEQQIVQHEMYHMYLPESDFTPEVYFSGIKNMLTVTDISYYGTQASRPGNGFLRRLYSAYKGTGSVYVIIANIMGQTSAYVPIVSYACDPLNLAESCDGPTTIVSKVLCGVLVFLGIFTCYFGHRFFKTEMFLVGFLVGGLVTFLILSMFAKLSLRDITIISLVIGCIFGLIWLAFWWYYGIPVLSTLLSLIVLGFLFASIIFYAGLGDITIVRNNITYWGFFTSIVLLTITVLTGFMHKANILACATVGSYAFIIPIDHYYGTNMKYIFINTVRRATVENFEAAIIDPPYQFKDLLLTLLWLTLAISGVVHQWRQQRGRPPFPPASARAQPPDERTPLLMPTSTMDPSDRIILIHSVPYDG
ncbi:hypothetical protein CBL_01947 [Carabus blaptoides fortunei]